MTKKLNILAIGVLMAMTGIVIWFICVELCKQ